MDKRMREARVDEALRHWKSKARDRFHYLYPPDLFLIDPNARRPYVVPGSFIPEPLGGSVQVRDRRAQGRYLGSEAADFIVGAFLPEGHKKRWEFRHFRAANEPSHQVPGSAAIDQLYGTATPSHPLSDLVGSPEDLPIEIDLQAARVYYPSVINVEGMPDHARYYWSDALAHVATSPAGDPSSVWLSRDPLSTPLTVLLPRCQDADEASYASIGSEVLRSIVLIPDLVMSRCFFANRLTLFAERAPLTRVVRFHHDGENVPAVVATKHCSEGVRLELDCQAMLSRIPQALAEDPALATDLSLACIGRELARTLISGSSFLNSLYEIEPLLTLLTAMDTLWTIEGGMGLCSFETRTTDEVVETIGRLIPGEGARLALAGFDQTDRARWESVFDQHGPLLRRLIAQACDRSSLVPFAEEVVIETLRRAVHLWAMRMVTMGDESLMVHLGRGPEASSVSITLYDALQGGSGVARTLYERILKDRATIARSFSDILRGVLRCDVDLMNRIEIGLLQHHTPERLYALAQGPGELLDQVIRQQMAVSIPAEASVLPTNEMDDLTTYVRRDFGRFAASEEMTAFFCSTARLYGQVSGLISRTPRATDLLLLDRGEIYDPRALVLWQQYLARESAGKSELLVRIEEMTPTCVGSCPECLEFEAFNTSRWDADWLIERRLLHAVLEG